MKGTRFQDSEAIKTAVTRELQAIPEESFQGCVKAWQRRLENSIRAQENYFEVTCCKIYLPNKIKHL